MNKQIPGFSNYTLTENNEVIRISDNKVMPIYLRAGNRNQRFLKLSDDFGIWKQIAYSKLIALTNGVSAPTGFTKVPSFNELWATEDAKFWASPSTKYPLGYYLSIYYPKNTTKYPVVSTKERGNVAVHVILALTFIDKNYLEKGLCVMHLDDDKANFKLSNLKVSTYSENNKAAYDTGVNPGKKQ